MPPLFKSNRFLSIISGICILVGLFVLSQINYLLFHTIAELFSIVVACCIFVIVWNTRHSLKNQYILVLGISYLFISGIDLLHTLAYKGMGVIDAGSSNYATQLWIAGRYLESFSFLAAAILIRRRFNANVIFTVYSIITACLIASIFYWNIFPVCYDDAVGLTPFKKISEYIISGLLLVSAFFLYKKKDLFENTIKIFLLISILLTVVSEIFFTLYRSVYGIHNLLGHYFKIISFYFVYYATIQTGLGKPFDLLLRNLKIHEEDLRKQKEFSESLIETARVIVLVLNKDGKIIRVNKFAEEITGYKAGEIQGKSWADIFLRPRDRVSTKQMLQKTVEETDIYDTTSTLICKDGHTIEVEWFDKRLCDKNGNAIGLICVGHDVTEQRSMENQKEVLIRELQDALSRVKTLQKLLPICSKCKKIRDDEGYWSRIEEYFDKHADTQFSHGLCPDCAELLYPGLYDKKFQAKEKIKGR